MANKSKQIKERKIVKKLRNFPFRKKIAKQKLV